MLERKNGGLSNDNSVLTNNIGADKALVAGKAKC